MTPVHSVRWWRIGVLCAALVLCLWIGWSEFDPDVAPFVEALVVSPESVPSGCGCNVKTTQSSSG